MIFVIRLKHKKTALFLDSRETKIVCASFDGRQFEREVY